MNSPRPGSVWEDVDEKSVPGMIVDLRTGSSIGEPNSFGGAIGCQCEGKLR
jgi:hypothetical protein